MTIWINHVAIAAPRNGTTSHTVTPSTGTVVAGTAFTPTAGRFLLCVVEGAVTSTTPSGWTLPTNGSSINNTGLYVWTKTAAGSDTLTTTHNGSNYPVIYDFYEFAAGSTFVKSATSTGVAYNGGAGPTLSSLTGTNWIAGAAGIANPSASTVTWTWGGGATEATDTNVVVSGTDGYAYSLAYLEDSVLTSSSLAATASTFPGGITTTERLMFAVQVASGATNYNGTATIAGTAATTTAGVVGKLTGAARAATAAIVTAGVIGASAGASVAGAAAITASGVVGVAPGSSAVTGTASTSAAGVVGTSSGTAVAPTAALTATGVVGAAVGSTVPATGTVTTAGALGTATGSSVAATATLAAAGTVTAVGAGTATVAAIAALTAAGVIGERTSATIPATAATTTTGVVGKATGTSVPVTVAITTTGVVTAGGTSTAAINAAVVVTATGTIAASGSSTVPAVATLTTSGQRGTTTGANAPATATITATGAVTAGVTSTATVTGHATITAAGTVVNHDTDRDITITTRLTPSPWDAGITDSPWTADLTDSPWHAQTGDTMIAGSLEYAHVTITADHDITADTVEASFDERLTWHTMSHASGNVWRILIGPGQDVNPTGSCTVFTRITDSPEIPVMNAGRLHVTTA